MNERGEFNCIVCDKQQEVLIDVKVKGDTIFCNHRGVCQSCLKNKDINKVCKEFSIRKVKEKINDLEISMREFKKQVKELQGEAKQK
jgi:SpoVK/Ycf46/Vps4 family AAA+-type ATPase